MNNSQESNSGQDQRPSSGANQQDEAAPFACSNCNKGHRKCDRKLPACSYCLLTNKSCLFDRLPQKRGPKKDDTKPRYRPYTVGSPEQHHQHTRKQDNYETKFSFHNFQPQQRTPPIMSQTASFFSPPNMQYQFHHDQPIPLQPISPNSLRQTPRMTTIAPPQPTGQGDKNFHNLYIHAPNVDRLKALAVYATKHGVPNDPNIPHCSNNDFALYYAMQAYYYKRNNNRILAQKCFETSREYIGQNYDQAIHNYDLACAFEYLALYLIDEGDMDRAAFYLETVQSYSKRAKVKLETQVEVQIRNMRDRLLRVLSATGAHLCGYAIDMTRVVKAIMCVCFITKQYNMFITMIDRQLKGELVDYPNDLQENLRFLDSIIDDLETSSSALKIDVPLLDKLAAKFSTTLPSQDVDIYTRHAQAVVIIQGAKIQALNRQDRFNDSAARQAADLIIHMTGNFTNHSWSQIIAQPLSLAINTHLRCIEACKNIEEKMKLAQQVKLGVNSLRSLGERYRIISIMYGAVMNTAEERVAMCEQEARTAERTENVMPALQEEQVKSPVKEEPDVKLQRFLAEIDPNGYDQVLFF